MKVVSLLLLLVLKENEVSSQYAGCDFFQALEIGKTYEIYSRGFKSGSSAKRNEACRWASEAPPGYKIELKCDFLYLFPIVTCRNSFKVSRRGRRDLADAESYCGWLGKISDKTSYSNRLTVAFRTYNLPLGSRFHCTIATVPDDCSCGSHNSGKIVGGVETIVNEYPSMAGIVDGLRGVVCGATIISQTAAVTAAHCLMERDIQTLRLLVGEHNVEETTETNFTKTLVIKRAKIHEYYNETTNVNDIALVFTESPITLNDGVGLSCLPFSLRNFDLIDQRVNGVGWGATEFGGPRSPFLRKVTLSVVNNAMCIDRQICTFTKTKDLCTYDSGGPIFFAKNDRLFNVGVVSFGIACATNDPGVNTRVTSYLDWIMSKTKSTVYCVK